MKVSGMRNDRGMELIILVIAFAVTGLIVGALGRLAIPGPNPMSIGMTIVVGIAGSFLGGLVGQLVFGRAGGLLLAVLGAALIVWLMQRNQTRRGILR